MSLKAKIEAVIYAAEEPVTLPQLAGLFGHEAEAELDHLHSAQQSLSLNENEAVLEAAAAADPTLEPDFSPGFTPVVPPPPLPEEQEAAASEVMPETSADPALSGPKSAAREDRETARRVREYLRTLIDQLIADYAGSGRGLEIREVAGGFRISTKPEYHDAVRGFVKSLKPPLKLTLQALETLAVVAYKQPVTAPEISEIRGVDSGGVLGSLMARKLITTAGRKQVIGRPILYKTTRDFLLRFGLKDVNELPSIEEFEKMAGELAEPDLLPASPQPPLTEELPMRHATPESAANLESQKNTHEAQADGIPGFELQEERQNEQDNRRADGDQTQADRDATLADQDGATADHASVDGRLSGLPPTYDDAADDPSALEGEIQKRSND